MRTNQMSSGLRFVRGHGSDVSVVLATCVLWAFGAGDARSSPLGVARLLPEERYQQSLPWDVIFDLLLAEDPWPRAEGPVWHNCRLYGALGADLPDNSLQNDLFNYPYSLRNLAQTGNVDGWGIAYYPSFAVAAPIQRGARRAYDCPVYAGLVPQLNTLEPYITLAHIRNCTSGCCAHGQYTIRDPHPFLRHKHHQSWTFAHNGGVDKPLMYALLDPPYLAANPPNCSHLEECDPCTGNLVIDSELYFLFIMQNIEEKGWNVPSGVQAAITALIGAGEDGALNFLLSNGESLWAFRRGGDSHTLWYRYTCGYGAAASQRPTLAPVQPPWEEMFSLNLVDLSTGQVIPNITTYEPQELLTDCAFNASANSTELRDNGPGQDWYEGRNDDPTLLTLHTEDIGSNATKKAALRNFGIAHNAYLTQELSTAQGEFVAFSFDIYVDRVQDNAGYDRTGLVYVGDDSIPDTNPPTGTSNERFVYLAFYDPTPGDTGNDLQIRARTSASQPYDTTAQWTAVTTGLSYDTWYAVKVILDVAGSSYDLYVNSILVGDGIPKYSGYASGTVTQVSFAADSDGRGDFYVDGVSAVVYDPPPPAISGTITWPNGQPAPNVTVKLFALDCSGGWSAMTNAEGYYHFDNVPSNEYRVSARRRVVCTHYGYDECTVTFNGCDPVTVDLTLATNWPLCPDVACSKSASADLGEDGLCAPVANGGEVVADGLGSGVRKPEDPMGLPGISGTVYWNCGTPHEPAPYVEVTARKVCSAETSRTQSDTSGNYWLSVPVGRYDVSARIRINGVWYRAVACGVRVDGLNPTVVNLTLTDRLQIVCPDCLVEQQTEHGVPSTDHSN